MKLKWSLAMTLLCAVSLFAARPTKLISNDSISGTVTFYKDTVYLLEGRVFVESGEQLNIQAGTVIKGMPGLGEDASVLVVCRGGKIYADGTESEPIIFTTFYDNEDVICDLGPDVRGLWGGLILLGYAPIDGGEDYIEGIPNDSRSLYGGNIPADNSGRLRYVSVRHGGVEIGEGNEINGVTFGGVGTGTVVEYVEVFASFDDGFEFFGGTVNCKYLVSAFVGDDAFDWDQGYRGKGQFWFAINSSDKGDRGAEMDGVVDTAYPSYYSKPILANVTFIGSGKTAPNPANDPALKFRESSGGFYYNSIFGEYRNRAIDIENKFSSDSYYRLITDSLKIKGSIFYNFGAGNTWSAICKNSWEADSLAPYNYIVNPTLRGIGRAKFEEALDPRPQVGSPALTNQTYPVGDAWFDNVNYIGAFGQTTLWAAHWTNLSQQGILANYLVVSPNTSEMISNQSFDIVMLIKVPNASIVNGSITLDGQNVTSTVINAWQPGNLVGGKYYRIPGVNTSLIGGVGIHTFTVNFTLSNGIHMSDTVVWKVVP